MNILSFRNVGCLATLLIAGLIWTLSCNANPDQPPRQNRYIYCNVYMDYACFGISGGDSLSMEMPSDFIIYSVNIKNEVKSDIYFGYHPQWRKDRPENVKNCSKKDDTIQCDYMESIGKLDILYEIKSTNQFIHIQMSGIDRSHLHEVHEFLANFRSCSPAGQSIQCTDDRIFKGIEL